MKSVRIRKTFLAFLIIFVLLVVGTLFVFSWYKKNVVPLAYSDYVEQYSRQYQVPPSVVFAVIKCESSFRPDAKSHAGALGLMQIMPDTFDWLCDMSDSAYTADMITDPCANIHMGVCYLAWLYDRFEDWELVYAAYNAGQNQVRKWINDGKMYKENERWVIPGKETRNYVEKVTTTRSQYLKLYPQLSEKEIIQL